MPGKFVITQREGGKFRFDLVAGNGQVIATSESFAALPEAHAAIDVLRRYAPGAIVLDETLAAG